MPSSWNVGAWPLLAGLGVVGVAVGAASARRPRRRLTGSAEPATSTHRPSLATCAPATVSTPGSASSPDTRIEVREPRVAAVEPPAYLALHHVDFAIETLRRHVEGESRTMPAAWLMLLDLYRTHGREQAFRELAERLHTRFNVRAPEWDHFPPDASDPGLEAFPRLIKEITLCWGTHECRRVLDRLLHDNRHGRRLGFTLNAYNDLMVLRSISDEVISTIEADLAEEALLRSAFAAASAALRDAWGESSVAERTVARGAGALMGELEAQLEEDLRNGGEARSPLEVEQPAMTGMLTREWDNRDLSARLRDILAQCDALHPLSEEAAADLAALKLVAGDLAGSGTDES